LIGEAIELTLNHGVYATRQAEDIDEAAAVLVDEWRPHLAVVDMDISGDRLVERLGWSGADGVTRVPTNDEPGDGRIFAG
jgi:hypothetical protein